MRFEGMPETHFQSVLAEAPATVANVGPGFDCFGLALIEPNDRVRVSLSKERGIRIKSIIGDGGRLPMDSQTNTAGRVVQSFVENLNIESGLELEIEKGLPLKSGLGSSAASSVAALLAVNHLFGSPLTQTDMLPLLMECEAMACGSAHADNVAPCLFGGMVMVHHGASATVLPIPVASSYWCVVFHPHVELATETARRVLPDSIPLATLSKQASHMVGLVLGLSKDDDRLVSESIRDFVAEPYRKSMIPGFSRVKQSVLEAGALGFGISGSGPSVFALCRGELKARDIRAAGEATYAQMDEAVDSFLSPLHGTGARIVEAC